MDEIKVNYGGKREESPSPIINGGVPSLESVEGEDKFKEDKSKASPFFGLAIKIGLYILTFLLPLFFLPYTANVLETNKQLLLFVFSFVLFVLWLAKVLVERKLEIKKSLLNILVVLFVVFVLVSSLLAKNAYAAFFGFGGVISESFLTVVCLAIIYFLAANTFKTKKEFDRLLFVLIGSSFLAGIFGLLQLGGNYLFSWDFARSVGFNSVGSVNSLEIFLASILVILVAMFIDVKRPTWQLAIGGGIAIAFLLILVSLNFSNVWQALLGIMAVVIGLGIMKRGRSSQTRLILAMVVLAMSLLFILTKINISGGWLNVPTEVSPSFSATLDVNKGALKDGLFFGSGPGSFAQNWELYRSELVNQTIFWNIRFTQGISKIFSLPSGLGLVGAAFWLLIVVFFAIWGAIKLLFNKGENWTHGFAFYSAWLFLAVVQFLYATNLTLEFLFWLLLGISFSLLKSLGQKEDAFEENKDVVSISFSRESPLASVFSFLLVIFLVLTISFFYLGSNFWRAEIFFQRGVSAANAQDLEKGSNEIVKAISLNSFRDNYLFVLSEVTMLRLSQELANPQSAERDTRARQFIADAVNLSKAATDLNPQNPDSWIQRGTVYRNVLGSLPGADEWVIKSFGEAVKLQPKNPYAYFELGRSYLLLFDFALAQAGQDQVKQTAALENLNKAEEQFNKAIEVKSDYSPAHYQLALIYDRKGEIDSAIEKMRTTIAGFPNDTGLAFQLGLLYYKKENFDQAKAEFERAVALDESYSNARYFLGLIYDRDNNKAAAKEQFSKIAELNPDNQEVQKILSNLESGKAALDGIAPPPEQRSNPPVSEKTPETR